MRSAAEKLQGIENVILICIGMIVSADYNNITWHGFYFRTLRTPGFPKR